MDKGDGWVVVALLALTGVLGVGLASAYHSDKARLKDVDTCRRLCYPAAALTAPKGADPVDCRCLWAPWGEAK